MNTQTVTLDLSKPTTYQQVNIGQGDTGGTTIEALVFDNGAQADLSGMSAAFVALLPDGKHYVRDTGCSIDGNSIAYTVDEEHVASIPGRTDEAYFELTAGGGSVYSTSRFTLNILRSALDGQEPAESWDSAVTDMIDRGNSAIDDVEDALQDATDGYAAAEASRNQQYAAAEQSRDQQFDTAEAERDAAQEANDTAQAKNNADQALNNQQAQGLQVQILGEGEYDADTKEPTVDGVAGKLYFVPSGESGDDAYIEWMWINSTWERVGMSNATIEAISTDQIDQAVADGSPQGEQVLNLTGLSYLWTKIKSWAQGAFAALSHQHSATDVTSGAFGADRISDGAIQTAKIADNAVTEAKLSSDLRDSLYQIAVVGGSKQVASETYVNLTFDLSDLGASEMHAVPYVATPSNSHIYGSVSVALTSISATAATVRLYNDSNSSCTPRVDLLLFYR
nr:MAG TPA: distal tail protein [Caudoviricetes sp.]